MDRLSSMAAFVRVAELKSFAAAAEALQLSPTMVANHVRALEERLGARLIERTTRRHTLTDVGQDYLERCRKVLASVDAAEQVAEAARTQPEGLLRITAPVTWGACRLMPVVAAYCAAHPAVRLELELNDRVVNLEEEGFHAGIRSGSRPGDRLVSTPLQPSQMWAAASPKYLAQRGHPKHAAELASHACLAFTLWGPGPVWRFTRNGETVTVPIAGPLTANNGQALLQAALLGMGVVVQADVLLESAIAQGALVRLLPDWQLATRPVQLVTSRRAAPSAKLRTFVEFVRERLG